MEPQATPRTALTALIAALLTGSMVVAAVVAEQTIVAIAATVCLTSLAVWLARRRDVRAEPTSAIVDALSAGKVDALGTAGKGWARVVAKLVPLVGTVRSTGGILTIAAGELDASSTVILGGARSVAAQADDIVGASHTAADQLQHLVHDGRKLELDAAAIATAANDAAQVSHAGHALVTTTVATAEALTVAADKISGVVSVIAAIAKQTNLLALNATIEAARAGQYGRGFSVVASSVKDLASETTDAAETVTTMVDQLQTGAAAVSRCIVDLAAVFAEIDAHQVRISTFVEQQVANTTRITSAAARTADHVGDIQNAAQAVGETAQRTSIESERANLAISEVHRLAQMVSGAVDDWTLPPKAAHPGSFSITVNRARNRLDIVLSGAWDLTTAQAYEAELASRRADMDADWAVCNNMVDLTPPTPEVQQQFRLRMAESLQAGMRMAVIIVPNPVIALQMQRAADTIHLPARYVTSPAEASAILDGDQTLPG